MSKLKPSIAAYSDNNSFYAHDSKSYKYLKKDARRKDARTLKAAKLLEKQARKAEREQRKRNWKETKRQLYIQAHSQNRMAEAFEAMNTVNPSKRAMKRYIKKLNNRDYREMVRAARRFK